MCFLTALNPIATLETSLEANYDRRTDKATYRGTSYRSAQKIKDEAFLETVCELKN